MCVSNTETLKIIDKAADEVLANAEFLAKARDFLRGSLSAQQFLRSIDDLWDDTIYALTNNQPLHQPTEIKNQLVELRREQLNRLILNLYRPYLMRYPDQHFSDLLQQRYRLAETRLMTVDQLQDLIVFMEQRLRQIA
jgi:hypothetical protein